MFSRFEDQNGGGDHVDSFDPAPRTVFTCERLGANNNSNAYWLSFPQAPTVRNLEP